MDARLATQPETGGDPVSVVWWWTPDCGFLHMETDPVYISTVCPDGLSGLRDLWHAEPDEGASG